MSKFKLSKRFKNNWELYSPTVISLIMATLIYTSISKDTKLYNIVSAIESIITALSIITGFICTLVPLLLSKIESSKGLNILFKQNSFKIRFKRILKALSLYSSLYLVVSILLLINAEIDLDGCVVITKQLMTLLFIWIFLGILFMITFIKITFLLLDTLFITDH